MQSISTTWYSMQEKLPVMDKLYLVACVERGKIMMRHLSHWQPKTQLWYSLTPEWQRRITHWAEYPSLDTLAAAEEMLEK